MKRFSKILAVLLILSVIPVSAATYPHFIRRVPRTHKRNLRVVQNKAINN